VSHTLLLADDSVTIQRVIELTFADEDVNVVAVSDGDEAIAVMDRTPPDIVLADIGMPGRNGYEVAQHVRDTPKLAHIPVVLLTGAFEPIDQAKATAAGCDGVLAKPFEPQLVIGRVKELLSKPKQGASLDAPLAPPPSTAGWAPGFQDPELPPARPSAEPGDYFERLDQAFANLSALPDKTPADVTTVPGATALDWFASQPPPAPLPPMPDVTRASSFETTERRGLDEGQGGSVPRLPDRWDVPASARAPEPITYAPPPPPPPPPPTLPPLADAFAALLAAEQASPSRAAAPVWPSQPQPGTALAITEDLIDQITRRVVERLADQMVQEMVGEKVAEIAELRVREEIERIKKSIG
jgi:CheY-like chemotaxis protein